VRWCFGVDFLICVFGDMVFFGVRFIGFFWVVILVFEGFWIFGLLIVFIELLV